MFHSVCQTRHAWPVVHPAVSALHRQPLQRRGLLVPSLAGLSRTYIPRAAALQPPGQRRGAESAGVCQRQGSGAAGTGLAQGTPHQPDGLQEEVVQRGEAGLR